MAESKYQVPTSESVNQASQQAKTLQADGRWQVSAYEWDVQKIQRLHDMSLSELVTKLKETIAAKVAMEELGQTYHQQVQNFTNQYNGKVKQLNQQFDQYRNQQQHPQKLAYLESMHLQGFPRELTVHKSDTTFAKRGFWLSIAVMLCMGFLDQPMNPMGVRSTADMIFALALLSNWAFIFFYITAKLHLSISQPVTLWHNHRLRAVQHRITKADQRYCEEHDLYNVQLLKNQFEYGTSLGASRGQYVQQMNQAHQRTETYLAAYANRFNTYVAEFPPSDTQDMRHLFRIFQEIMTGRASTWQEATVLVDQSEQMNQFQDTLIQEIHSAKQAIVQAVDQTRDDLTDLVSQSINETRNLTQATKDQTDEIAYWSELQLEATDHQNEMLDKHFNGR